MQKSFYSAVVRRLLKKKILTRAMRILVVCGGKYDQEVFHGLKFTDVTISNLDSRITGSEFAPYEWSFQDAEALTFADNEFDIVAVHSGLHHCRSPHRALLEMYRVAKQGVLVFENRDNGLIKLATQLGFNSDYEIEAVVDNGYQFGGVENSAIPNYIYRWNEREVKKTIWSFSPEFEQTFHFFYGLRLPFERLKHSRAKIILPVALLFSPIVRFTALVFPKLSNQFGFFVQKPAQLKPWLKADGAEITLNKNWVDKRYK